MLLHIRKKSLYRFNTGILVSIFFLMFIFLLYNAPFCSFKETYNEYLEIHSTDLLKKRVQDVEKQNQLLRFQLYMTKKNLFDVAKATITPQELEREETSLSNTRMKKYTCEAINVVILCSGFEITHSLVTLIKSIVFYRKNPLHFYFLTNTDHLNFVLDNLFKTWMMPNVDVTFINASTLVQELEWFQIYDYFSSIGSSDVVLTKPLPENVNRVIVLKPNIIFASNIGDLWSIFEDMKNQPLGLVKSQNGYNTDLVLMNFSKLKNFGWSEKWNVIKESQWFNDKFSHSHDTFSNLIEIYPQIVYKIPCEWNMQVNQDDTCFDRAQDWKVFNLNGKKESKRLDYFEKMQLSFVEYNGNLLRRELLKCDSADTADVIKHKKLIQSLDKSDMCYYFRKAALNVYRTHLYFLPYKYEYKENDLTLVTQLTLDRFHMTELLAKHWSGPMSLAFYLSDLDAQKFLSLVRKSSSLSHRRNIGYHIVYQDGDFYPINHLRNIALNNANTSFVFLLDVDFLPPSSLYSYLLQYLANNYNNSKTAYVIPAFEMLKYNFRFPTNKDKLLKLIDSGIVTYFQQNIYPVCHKPTNFLKWRTATSPYLINWAPYFEPYIVVHREVIKYDQRFVGFGWNKISHILELYMSGYNFVVLPEAYIVHLPHTFSAAKIAFSLNSDYRCVSKLVQEFVDEAIKKYPNTFTNEMWIENFSQSHIEIE